VRRISARHPAQSHPGFPRLPPVPVSQAPAHPPAYMCLISPHLQPVCALFSPHLQPICAFIPPHLQPVCALLSPHLQPKPDPCTHRQAVAVETIATTEVGPAKLMVAQGSIPWQITVQHVPIHCTLSTACRYDGNTHKQLLADTTLHIACMMPQHSTAHGVHDTTAQHTACMTLHHSTQHA